MTDEARKRLDQLKRALELGAIDQDTFDVAAAAIGAQLSGGGAVAQRQDALAVGAHGVGIGRDNYGDVNTGILIQQAAKPGASKGDLRRAYLARILNQANQLPLFSGDSANAQIKLSSVYTALLTQRPEGSDSGIDHPWREVRQMAEREATRFSALDVLNGVPKLVLLGGPGSGKSTFVNFVALCMAGEMLGATGINLATLTAPIPPEPDSREKEPRPQRWNHGALLPVHVVLRDLASELPAPGAAANADTVWQHIEGRLQRAALGNFAPHLQDELLKRGGLILLDGLDEVPDPFTRREQVKQAVQDFADTFGQCRFLVTSRTYAYTRQDWKLTGFAEVALLPFTPGQVQRFVDAWYAHMSELDRLSDSDAKGRADLLKRTIERNERLAELAERPLLLTLIARLHTERGGALPEKREELYAQAVELLLNQWESLKVRFKPDGSKEIAPSLAEWLNAGRDDIRRELDKLAFEAHRDQAELVGMADIPNERLVLALLNAAPGETGPRSRLLAEYLRDRAGLLATHGEGLYQFPHRTFQEYLAACHLTVDRFRTSSAACCAPTRTAGARRRCWPQPRSRAARPNRSGAWWRRCARTTTRTARVEPPAADLWGPLLAGQALSETGLAEPSPNTAARDEAQAGAALDVRHRRARLVVVVGSSHSGHGARRLGDDRELDELVPIPAGEFWMGDDQNDDAKPRHRVRLPGFKIGKYPVTNEQYLRFIQAARREWDSTAANKAEKRNQSGARCELARRGSVLRMAHGRVAQCWEGRRVRTSNFAQRGGVGTRRARHRRPGVPLG